MDAAVRAPCPKCRTVLRIPTQWVGQAVKCKKCGTIVRCRPKNDSALPGSTGTGEAKPVGEAAPAQAFDFSDPPALDEGDFRLPETSSPAMPEAQPLPPGYVPPGYAYPAPPAPGYVYGPPTGYPYPAPPAAHPYPVPPGYPQPGASAVPPGYPYPVHPGVVPHPAPVVVAPAYTPQPVAEPHQNYFQTETPAFRSGQRYRRSSGKSKWAWMGFCLFLTAGLVAGGIYGLKFLNGDGTATNGPEISRNGDGSGEVTDSGTPAKAGPFPRRLLFMHISKYMYLNPLTATQPGSPDRTKSAALRMAYEWRVPTDKDNNQVFVLSDTAPPLDLQTPMKNVVMGTYQQFFETSRPQDRIVVYFGGHAVEKDGKAFLAPMEAEPDDVATLIPLDEFYANLTTCKATQKVMIWDVCRFNPERGRQRPGSEPMTETLAKALLTAPPGVEVVLTCQPGENALEFYNLQIEPTVNAPKYSGSAFLESLKYVANKTQTDAKPPTPADPIPIQDWVPLVGKRVTELATSPVVGLQQTLKLDGTMPTNQVLYSAQEAPAKRFEFPTIPKGTAVAEIRAIEQEFLVPPIRTDLADSGLAELPFLESVMKDYKADRPLQEIEKNPEKFRLRTKTLAALELIRSTWNTKPNAKSVTQLREELIAPITDTKKREILQDLDTWAEGIARFELIDQDLDTLESQRDSEPKRWQAHFDYARAAVKARLAFMNEYNKVMGDARTESLPSLDMKLGQDRYKLVSSETIKNKKGADQLAKDARELYEKIILEHKGTPWAMQAKREKAFSLGLAWRPATSGKPTD